MEAEGVMEEQEEIQDDKCQDSVELHPQDQDSSMTECGNLQEENNDVETKSGDAALIKSENADGVQSTDGSDPYAYTKRNEFTSENFKIELRGLPRHYNIGQLKKLLNETLQLKAHKVKPAGPRKNFAYIAFRDQKAKDKAMIVLDEYKWKKAVFSVSNAKPVEDPLVKYRSERDAKRTERPDPDRNLPIEERVTKSVTPYSHLSYEEQLQQKQKEALQFLRKFGCELARVNPELKEWANWQKVRRKGQICEVDDIIPSPVTECYRNKCEFTIGINPENGLPTVGFRISSYRDGSVHVGPIGHFRHLPDSMKRVVEGFEKFIRSSGLAPFNPQSHEGVWRQLNVRTTRNKDLLIVPLIHPQAMTPEDLNELKNKIVAYFTENEGTTYGVTAIFFKAFGQKIKSTDEEPLEHLWGEKYIVETILDKKFRVSPEAFLQVNTAAAEVLYKTVGDIAELDGTSALMDICCGTGTIGISLAERCLKVYGVEIVEKAAEDARHNANLNDLKNVVVFTGRAEDHMQLLIQHTYKVKTVGVVDPPRAGLNGSVVFGLRKAENMKRLVYVSCDPSNATKNFISLARPQSKQYKGEYFVPVRAVPVDLFPHTPHYELIILFERWDELKWRRIMEGNPLPRDEDYFNRIPQKPKPQPQSVEQDKPQTVTGYGDWKSASSDNRGSKHRFQPYPHRRFANQEGFEEPDKFAGTQEGVDHRDNFNNQGENGNQRAFSDQEKFDQGQYPHGEDTQPYSAYPS